MVKYIECNRCNYRLAAGSLDPHKELCKKCNNTREVQDPETILCNMCGECMCPKDSSDNISTSEAYGLVNAKITGGYFSYHLFDMTSYKFNLCELCLRKLFNNCKIPPSINEIDFDGAEHQDFTYIQDQEMYEYRVWQKEGGHHQAYLNGKCNAIKDCPEKAIYTKLISSNFSEECSCEEHKDIHMYMNSSLVDFIPDVLKAFI